ncbi:basigin [Elysia marginata]|uniref:Basigin n=1 Tax=Elysia marginata TaxID=1093978 RepID=A0AAV4JSZ8_9GAST|nr:basigin [Elysia marginata]
MRYNQVEGGEEPVVSIIPNVSQLLVKDGGSIEFQCIGSNPGGEQLKWEFPRQQEDAWRYAHLSSVDKGKAKAELKIINVTDSGDYTCVLDKDSGRYTDTVKVTTVSESKLEPTFQYGNTSAKLSCVITNAQSGISVESISWKKGETAVTELPEGERFESNGVDSLIINDPGHGDTGLYTAFITVKNFDKPYECEVRFKDQIVEIHPTKVEPTYEEGLKTAVLSCVIDEKWKVKHVEWLKNNTSVSKDDSGRFSISENKSLIIDTPERKDAGIYVMRHTLERFPEPYDCEVMFKVPPFVLGFTKSKNLIEKDKMELQCRVEGFPKAVVTWMKNDVALNVTDDDRIELHTLKGYKNARLVIKNIEFSDEGEYSCHAYSSFFNQSFTRSVTVRVKDKLAALWPFLGIVCEVLILCTIIFIYEKRRNKRAEQEENKAQEAFIKEQKEGVRHRNQKK